MMDKPERGIPLPATLVEPLGLNRTGGASGPTANAGLVFDRYCDRWTNLDGTPQIGGEKKSDWLRQTFVDGRVGEQSELEETIYRQIALVGARGGRWAVFETVARFVTGLGSPNPVENGFVWHHTLGVPYMAGSSLKGLVRAWGREVGVADEMNRLLGESSSAGPSRVGKVDLLAAVPIEPVKLAVDVMTPHYAGWDASNPPGDWMSPTPIPFLVCEPGAKFLFAAHPGHSGKPADVERVWELLVAALDRMGAGAKTALGYGRFRESTDSTESLRRERMKRIKAIGAEQRRVEAQSTPEGRWGLEVEERNEEQVLELVRTHLMGGELSDPMERRALAQAIESAGYPTVWAKGNKVKPQTNVGAKKLKERAKAVRAELPDH